MSCTRTVSRGYGSMEMSYYSFYDGILTVNYAAVQNGVILYPDLIKLQLSAKDGAVIGLEAAHYLMNHAERTIELPVITEEEALSHLGALLTAQSVRLTLPKRPCARSTRRSASWQDNKKAAH